MSQPCDNSFLDDIFFKFCNDTDDLGGKLAGQSGYV